jgi:hypothetical protein
MTAQLPMPGSTWMQMTGRAMRAVLVNSTNIVCHDCELTSRNPDLDHRMMSWSGTPDEFFQVFRPLESGHYPQTATAP